MDKSMWEHYAPVPTEQIRAWIDEFVEKYPHSLWGPGHITLEDSNVHDSNLKFVTNLCLAVLGEYTGEDTYFESCVPSYRLHAARHGISQEEFRQEMRETIALMGKIAQIPEEERFSDDYRTSY